LNLVSFAIKIVQKTMFLFNWENRKPLHRFMQVVLHIYIQCSLLNLFLVDFTKTKIDSRYRATKDFWKLHQNSIVYSDWRAFRDIVEIFLCISNLIMIKTYLVVKRFPKKHSNNLLLTLIYAPWVWKLLYSWFNVF